MFSDPSYSYSCFYSSGQQSSKSSPSLRPPITRVVGEVRPQHLLPLADGFRMTVQVSDVEQVRMRSTRDVVRHIVVERRLCRRRERPHGFPRKEVRRRLRSEEHTSELQSRL